MKKLNILTLAAAAVLTLGTTAALTACGGDKTPDTPVDPEGDTKKDLKLEITDPAGTKYTVGQKAHFKFTTDGKELTGDEKNTLFNDKATSGFEVTYSVENTAVLREWDGYIAFSQPGKVTVTVKSNLYKTVSATFEVGKRAEVAGKVNLVISGPAAQAEFMKTVADQYNATLADDKKINFIFEDHGEDKLDSEVLNWKEGPDVFAFASDKIAELTSKGALATLGGTYKDHVKNTMTDGAIEAASFPTAEDIVAYPYAGDNGYYLFYNKKLLKDSDIASMDALFDAAKAKKLKVGYPLNTPFYSAGALFTFGARYQMDYDENGALNSVTADFDGQKGLLAGKAILDIMTNESYQEGQEAPTGEKLIACVDGSWNAAVYKETMEKHEKGSFACAKLPTVTAKVGDVTETANLSSFLGYKLYGVNKTKQNERAVAAQDFAKYLTSKEVQKLRFEKFSIAPTNKELAVDPTVTADPAIKAINEQSKFAVAQTAVPAGVWGAPGVFTQAIIDGKVNEDNLQTFMTTLNNGIKKVD